MAVAYVDRSEASTVAGSHVGVESLDGGDAGGLAVLLVHVVGTRPGVVADPDAEVLDSEGVLLGDLRCCVSARSHSSSKPGVTYDVDADNLASGLLHLAETAEEVPETGLGNDLIRRKDAHAVEAGSRVGLRGQMAPDDLVFLETSYNALSVHRRNQPVPDVFAALGLSWSISSVREKR